jgi:hypothetical protein
VPPPPPAPPRSLPPLAWTAIIGAAVLALAIVVLLAFQLAVLTDSRKHIVAQDAKIARLYDAARPVVDQAEPLAREAKPLLRQAGPFVGHLRRALGTLDRYGPDLGQAATAVPPLLRATEALADGALPLVRGLDAAGLPRVAASADAVLGSLLEGGRLVGVLDATGQILARVRAEDLISRSAHAARVTPRRMRRLVRIQRRTLRVQLQSRDIQAQTLAEMRRAVAAVESIDRKTGGRFPPTPAAAATGR